MRIANVITPEGNRLAALRDGMLFPFDRLGFAGDLLELIDAGPGALAELQGALDNATADIAMGQADDFKFAAPIPKPRRTIFCAGKNYADHAAEYTHSGYDKPGAKEMPDMPVSFFKLAECVVGPDTPVEAQPGTTSEMDYEAELAAILWSGGRGLSQEDAKSRIFGYAIVNDVTARDWQKGHDQWVLGKSFDGYMPMGPIVVTADEVEAMSDLSFDCYVNDELRQKGDPTDLIFDVPYLVSYFSRGITMLAGDIIATGSPLGPGIGFNPPKFLQAGDVVRIESPLMGTLTTPII